MCLLCVHMRAKTLQGEECGRSARGTVDIGLDISVVLHLTSDAVDAGFLPGTNHTSFYITAAVGHSVRVFASRKVWSSLPRRDRHK